MFYKYLIINHLLILFYLRARTVLIIHNDLQNSSKIFLYNFAFSKHVVILAMFSNGNERGQNKQSEKTKTSSFIYLLSFEKVL